MREPIEAAREQRGHVLTTLETRAMAANMAALLLRDTDAQHVASYVAMYETDTLTPADAERVAKQVRDLSDSLRRRSEFQARQVAKKKEGQTKP